MNAAFRARKAATASGPDRSRTNVTCAGSTPCRRSTACMQSHGVGAPPNEMTVRPTRSDQLKRDRGSRPTRKNPFRSFTAAKWTRRVAPRSARSEEHTSELQSRGHLVCRLLLEKKKPGKVKD